VPKKARHIDATELQSMARAYTDTVLNTLGGIASNGTSEAARVSACAELLNRGWGRPAQPVTGKDGAEDIKVTIRTIVEGFKK
jgi:hypothetical protein